VSLVCEHLVPSFITPANDSLANLKREAKRSTSAPNLDRHRLRQRGTAEEAQSEPETPQDEIERSEETPEAPSAPGTSPTERNSLSDSGKRASRIQRDSTGRRVIKGNADKPVLLNSQVVQGTKLSESKRKSSGESRGILPEGYSDWDEVPII
jgi:hypothetical protein